MKTSDIRQSFLDYFQKYDHRLVASAPVIPFDDPTLLFINAGMNQFKDVFTGQRRVDYSRATSSQKCIRAGGKHNDLDNVGFTARHHTFFEMLGNFSFGDYYKEEAIFFAWEWVTKYLELPKDRLYATVFETDDDAFALWEKIAPELKNGRVMRFGKKDNFWSMGPVGPCGPCSELHFDRGEKYGNGPDDVINGETDRFVEIWNLVFMQDDQLPDGKVVPLPNPSVDTGAGLERIAAIMQNAKTNYGIDLFQNIIRQISELTGTNYGDNVSSHHVIADHIRSLSFAIADGAGISNEGRGYVLRRILRRAARHGRQLGAREPFIYKLVPTLTEEMGEAFPELVENQQHVMNVIRTEEESFLRTLETGLDLFEKAAAKVKDAGNTIIPGEDVFRLYDTYGFPYDLTEIIATEQGLQLDREGFDLAMKRQQEQSRAAANFDATLESHLQATLNDLQKQGLEGLPPTEFVRDSLSVQSKVLRTSVVDFPRLAVVVDKTPLYIEAGGQISDTGHISCDRWSMSVQALHLHQGYYIHLGEVTNGTDTDVQSCNEVSIQTESTRRWDIMRNHTATHLMHAALRKVLGEHVKQSGSYVGPDRLRFDFSHHQPMTAEEIAEVERLVNEAILLNTPVTTEEMDIKSAKKSGAMALFGEKYADTVRVVSVGDFSKELCGGTHVREVSQIGLFIITLETGIASGVRRIEAITGREAVKEMVATKEFRRQTAEIVGRPAVDALDGVRKLREENLSLQKELKRTKEAMFAGGGSAPGEQSKIGPIDFVTYAFGPTDRDTMSAWADAQKEANRPLVAIGMGEVGGKGTYIAAASSSAVKEYKVHVGALTKELLPQFGGRGGGKPTYAQGSTGDGVDPQQVFDTARSMLEGLDSLK